MRCNSEHNSKNALLVISIVLLIVCLISSITIINLTGRIVDGSGIIDLCLNHPPAIDTVSNQLIAHNVAYFLDINASDADNNTLSYNDNTSLFNINNNTGVINFTPAISDVGNHSILIIARDVSSDCPQNSTISFNLNINNTPPQLNQSIADITWEEDIWYYGVDLDHYFIDLDLDALTFSAQSGDHVNVSILENNSILIKPETDWSGISWMRFIANDSISAAYSNNITLNITPVGNFCGDGICNANESCSICSADCGECPSSSTSSTGSGGGSWIETPTRTIRHGDELKVAKLEIIAPKKIYYNYHHSITVPITIRNIGDFAFSDLYLTIMSTSQDITIAPITKYLGQLNSKENKAERFDLKISNSQAEGKVQINVYSPEYQITGFTVINIYKQQIKNMSLLEEDMLLASNKINITKNQLSQNPECMELLLILEQAQQMYDQGQYAAATDLADKAASACTELLQKAQLEAAASENFAGQAWTGLTDRIKTTSAVTKVVAVSIILVILVVLIASLIIISLVKRTRKIKPGYPKINKAEEVRYKNDK